MATTKNTKNTKTTNTTNTTKTRETVELPDNLVVGKADVQLSEKVTRKRENPLLKAVTIANGDREQTYSVKGIQNQKQADKVIRLLVDAGRKLDPPCSLRTKYDATAEVVYFRAIDLVTRQRKPK